MTHNTHRVIFTLVADVTFDTPDGAKPNEEKMQLQSAQWAGIEPEVAFSLLHKVILEKEVQARLGLERDRLEMDRLEKDSLEKYRLEKDRLEKDRLDDHYVETIPKINP